VVGKGALSAGAGSTPQPIALAISVPVAAGHALANQRRFLRRGKVPQVPHLPPASGQSGDCAARKGKFNDKCGPAASNRYSAKENICL
jgi:hypothetical protein